MTPPPRRRLLPQQKLPLPPNPSFNPEDLFWQQFNLRIQKANVIPIISNSVMIDRIFDINRDYDVGLNPEEHEQSIEAAAANSTESSETLNLDELTIGEELAQIWAETIGYPMPDNNQLARVAMYNQVKSLLNNLNGKAQYLYFLKEYLLDLAATDPDVVNLGINLPGLKLQAANLSFSEIARMVGYPKFDDEHEDPLALLARFPFRIYITTSYYDFMEVALAQANKEPRTQICFWSGELSGIDLEHQLDRNLIPTVEKPLVFHLYGYEQYPNSLVLSEDDYLDFLKAISMGDKGEKSLLPLYLQSAIAESSLILLGYRLHDWDFKVLFRGIIQDSQSYRQAKSNFGLAIQLDPAEQPRLQNQDQKEAAHKYLEEYFKPSFFRVEWGAPHRFVRKLWDRWEKWSKAV